MVMENIEIISDIIFSINPFHAPQNQDFDTKGDSLSHDLAAKYGQNIDLTRRPFWSSRWPLIWWNFI